MIILGIDPGTATTGYGVIKVKKGFPKLNKSLEFLKYGVIKTDPVNPQGKRLSQIYIETNKLLKENKPDILAIESLYFFKNLKTALPVSEAKGVILLAAAKKKIKVLQVTPLEVKMNICGYGRAQKKQVQRMVKETLNMDKIPRPDDAADALAVAVCGVFKEKRS